jgi:imidazoleglycerol-phosphate dehydratase / histidinol-phosphatase
MKKLLFIDRDGTIIIEPPVTEQIDSLELLEFLPGAITSLYKIATETDYELVMVTNQDGLGTDFFPEEKFWPAHEAMLKILEGEGIKFTDIYIDRSFPHDNLSTRKPGTGMLTKYFSAEYDLKNSFVIGDRLTDIELAKNLGCKAIFINSPKPVGDELMPYMALKAENWKAIYSFLKSREK